jgi:hypothetical protein
LFFFPCQELERKLEISTASSVDKDMLRSELEDLRKQIKEATEAEVMPKGEYDRLAKSHSQLQERVRDLQAKVRRTV